MRIAFLNTLKLQIKATVERTENFTLDTNPEISCSISQMLLTSTKANPMSVQNGQGSEQTCGQTTQESTQSPVSVSTFSADPQHRKSLARPRSLHSTGDSTQPVVLSSPHRHGNAASTWGCESEAHLAPNFVCLTELIDQTSCFLTCEGQPFPESPHTLS